MDFLYSLIFFSYPKKKKKKKLPELSQILRDSTLSWRKRERKVRDREVRDGCEEINCQVWKMMVVLKLLSCVRLFVTPGTVAHQAPLSMQFSRQEYWSGLPFPSPGDLPNPGVKPRSPALQADSLPSESPGKPMRKRVTLKAEYS